MARRRLAGRPSVARALAPLAALVAAAALAIRAAGAPFVAAEVGRRALAAKAGAALAAASAAAPAALAAENCEGSIFEGTYAVPPALGGTATLTVRAAVAVARGTVDGRPWEVRSTRIQGAPLIARLAGR